MSPERAIAHQHGESEDISEERAHELGLKRVRRQFQTEIGTPDIPEEEAPNAWG